MLTGDLRDACLGVFFFFFFFLVAAGDIKRSRVCVWIDNWMDQTNMHSRTIYTALVLLAWG